MSIWVYVAWFRDLLADPDDEDYEWVAVMSIAANSAEAAKSWGDRLAIARASREDKNEFLWSEIHLPSDPMYEHVSIEELPLVQDGIEPEDSAIGW
ncbi:MAG: hypothetical protein KF892_24330 [Rhizobacter sp.]|nr:hypothetical protein [Rhizobacter sp.]